MFRKAAPAALATPADVLRAHGLHQPTLIKQTEGAGVWRALVTDSQCFAAAASCGRHPAAAHVTQVCLKVFRTHDHAVTVNEIDAVVHLQTLRDGGLDCTNVINYFAAHRGSASSLSYIVMEYAPGGAWWDDYQQQVRRATQDPSSVTARMLKASAGAVETAAVVLGQLERLYRAGMLINDAKPQNICFQDGVVKIIDLGAATFKGQHTLTDLAHLNITPGYAAPEHHDALAAIPASGTRRQLTHTWAAQLYHFGSALIDMLTLCRPGHDEHYSQSIARGVQELEDQHSSGLISEHDTHWILALVRYSPGTALAQ